MTDTISRADRAALTVFSAIAATLGLIMLIHGILRLRLYVVNAADGGTPLELLTSASLPVEAHDTTPGIVTGGFSSAHLLATGLTDGTRALLAAGEGITALVAVVVSAGIAFLLFSLSRGRPFAKPLFTLAVLSGATLTIGGLLGQALAGFGRMTAADELNPVADDLFTPGFTIDAVPIFAGFAILALAFVFRAGTRLQRDTDGLV